MSAGLQALAATPVGFLRIVGLVLFWLLSRIAATERAKARLWQRQTMKYGPIVRTSHPAIRRFTCQSWLAPPWHAHLQVVHLLRGFCIGMRGQQC